MPYSISFASGVVDTSTTTNTTTTSPTEPNLNTGTVTPPFGGCPSGTTPINISNSVWGTSPDYAVRWGECVSTFEISVAINQALTQSGISVDKAHYKWHWINGCFNTPSNDGNHFCDANINNRINPQTGVPTGDKAQYFDTLAVTIDVTDAAGNVIKTVTWTAEEWYHWHRSNSYSTNETPDTGGAVWQIEEGNIEFYNHTDMIGQIYGPNQLGSIRFRFDGQDKGQWDGYYGPVISNVQTWFTYRTNPCTSDALYDPSCPGYAEAYATFIYNQQCTANPLYDSGCPGYAAAYFTQQCTANPLYDAACPGYADAYYTQQCELDPLYDSGCDGYATAYLNQQCSLDPLYDTTCTGYDAAYLSQQCDLDATYSIQCTGYEQAYFDKQCLLNPQYDELCTGYVAPVVETDVDDIVDDGTGTGDSVVDSVIDTPSVTIPGDIPGVDLVPEIPEIEIQIPEIEIEIPEIEVPEVEIEIQPGRPI